MLEYNVKREDIKIMEDFDEEQIIKTDRIFGCIYLSSCRNIIVLVHINVIVIKECLIILDDKIILLRIFYRI